jgi:predicted nucleic acid-binding protein
MNVVDSSAWLEFFAGGNNAKHFKLPLTDTKNLIVPTITLYEVFKIVLRERDEGQAIQAIALMKQGKEINLDSVLALDAAKISTQYKIPMADSIILATAQKYNAILWTQDDDFKNLHGVKYFAKK